MASFPFVSGVIFTFRAIISYNTHMIIYFPTLVNYLFTQSRLYLYKYWFIYSVCVCVLYKATNSSKRSSSLNTSRSNMLPPPLHCEETSSLLTPPAQPTPSCVCRVTHLIRRLIFIHCRKAELAWRAGEAGRRDEGGGGEVSRETQVIKKEQKDGIKEN